MNKVNTLIRFKLEKFLETERLNLVTTFERFLCNQIQDFKAEI